jgi:alkanesulfonate monooxygenase SsuD/methylene tetrahydromethanopterin reductase-like flavin-dependent oxidoreductase (luciferase family)
MVEQRRRTRPGSYASWEEIQKAGFVVVGSPATVRDRLKQIATETGLGTLVPNFSIGNVPHHLTRKSMELFAHEVMPALRGLNVDEPATQESGVSSRESGGRSQGPEDRA